MKGEWCSYFKRLCQTAAGCGGCYSYLERNNITGKADDPQNNPDLSRGTETDDQCIGGMKGEREPMDKPHCPRYDSNRGDKLWLREHQLQKEDIVSTCADLRSKNTAGAIPPIVDSACGSKSGSSPDESVGARFFNHTTTTDFVRPCMAAGGSTRFERHSLLPNPHTPPAADTDYPVMRRAQDERCAILASGKHGDSVPSIVLVHHSGERDLSLPPLVLHILRGCPFAFSNHFLSWDYDDYCSALSTC